MYKFYSKNSVHLLHPLDKNYFPKLALHPTGISPNWPLPQVITSKMGYLVKIINSKVGHLGELATSKINSNENFSKWLIFDVTQSLKLFLFIRFQPFSKWSISKWPIPKKTHWKWKVFPSDLLSKFRISKWSFLPSDHFRSDFNSFFF